MFVSLKLKFPKSSSVETLKNFASFNSASCRGTNPSLVEAMNLSIPILAFDYVYNRATTEEKCLYWKIAEDLQNLMKNKSGNRAKWARLENAFTAGSGLRMNTTNCLNLFFPFFCDFNSVASWSCKSFCNAAIQRIFYNQGCLGGIFFSVLEDFFYCLLFFKKFYLIENF